MSLRGIGRAGLATLAAGMLSACTAMPSSSQVEDFITQHTACPKASYLAPHWSADGGRITYFRGWPGSQTYDLIEMSASGKNERLLAHDLPDNAQLSPDGTKILYIRHEESDPLRSVLYLEDLATGQTRPLELQGYETIWSPDSQWIAFSRYRVGVGKLNVLTGETIMLLDASGSTSVYVNSPQWSPDGKQLAFRITSGDEVFISVINADGSGGVTRIASVLSEPVCESHSGIPGNEPILSESVVGWSPDGRLLAVAHGCEPHWWLRILTLDGDDQAWLGDRASTVFNDWSPDSQQVVVTEYNISHGLSIASVDGKTIRSLNKGSGGDWSPDGSRIVFLMDGPDGMPEVYTVQPDGSGLTQITNNPGHGMCLH